MGWKRIDWDLINAGTKLTGIRYRYYRCENGRIAIWTTVRLYKDGDYAAYLVEPDGTILQSRYMELRKHAATQAFDWSRGWQGRDYTITEEP